MPLIVDGHITDWIPLAFLVAVLLIAVVTDLREQRIPNLLTLPAAVLAVIYFTVRHGTDGLWSSLAGLGLGYAIWLILYAIGKMGAGDVKLVGAVGALIGPREVAIASLFIAIGGGLYAIVLLAWSGSLGKTIRRYGSMAKALLRTGKVMYLPPVEQAHAPELCYGVAIALGTLLALGWHFV